MYVRWIRWLPASIIFLILKYHGGSWSVDFGGHKAYYYHMGEGRYIVYSEELEKRQQEFRRKRWEEKKNIKRRKLEKLKRDLGED